MVKINQKYLEVIWKALSAQKRTNNPHEFKRVVELILKQEWMFSSDFENLLYYSDNRLADFCYDIDMLVESLGYKWTPSLPRPSILSRMDYYRKGMGLSDAAALLMFLEGCGFDIDTTMLLKAIRPSITRKKILSMAEVDVYRCEQRRDKMSTSLEADDIVWDWGNTFSGKLPNGYKFSADFQKDKSISSLTIYGSKYRRTKPPELTMCKECGYQWMKGDPEESKVHRETHSRRMKILEPQPNENMERAFRTENNPELINYTSPDWKHNEILDRAFAFKRELGFDFAQWSKSDSELAAGNVVGYLFTKEHKTIIGAASFRKREYDVEGTFWELDWVWIAPKYRRTGILKSRWPLFREQFGDFYVSHPISRDMKYFLSKVGDDHLALLPSER